MHPALLLMNLIGLLVMYMAPLLGWYMLRGGRDRNSDLWFGAALVYAVGSSGGRACDPSCSDSLNGAPNRIANKQFALAA